MNIQEIAALLQSNGYDAKVHEKDVYNEYPYLYVNEHYVGTEFVPSDDMTPIRFTDEVLEGQDVIFYSMSEFAPDVRVASPNSSIVYGETNMSFEERLVDAIASIVR